MFSFSLPSREQQPGNSAHAWTIQTLPYLGGVPQIRNQKGAKLLKKSINLLLDLTDSVYEKM